MNIINRFLLKIKVNVMSIWETETHQNINTIITFNKVLLFNITEIIINCNVKWKQYYFPFIRNFSRISFL